MRLRRGCFSAFLFGVFIGSMVHEKNPDVLGGLRGLELLDTLRFWLRSQMPTFLAYSSRSSEFVWLFGCFECLIIRDQ
jgi:hypothetical protein